jgi:glycosyltransferase involved in cell wall biosynthesis
MSSRRFAGTDLPPVSVAHVTTISESLEMLLLDQLCAIAATGIQVTGVSAPGVAVDAIERAGIRHLPAPFVRATRLTPTADLRLIASLVRMFKRERFTIVHTHTAKADLFAAIAARLAGVPFVVTTLHGFYFHDLTPEPRRTLFAQLARLGMMACDVVLSQNLEDIETAMRERICPPSKIEFLGNGIDIQRFTPDAIDQKRVAALRAELGLESCVPVVGYVGRLVAEKGLLELFDAMRAVRERHPDARLLLVGMIDDAKHDAIRPATAVRYGIADATIFAGHRRDMPEFYSLMDLLVLPSHREGLPRSPMEAAAMEVPVIATDIRGCRSTVIDGRTGTLVPVRDARALAEAIAALLDNPMRRHMMGRAGRELATSQFDQRTVFRKVIATYDRLLAGMKPT